jgi:hypothetical protein
MKIKHNSLVITWRNHDYDITSIDYVKRVDSGTGVVHVLRCFHNQEAFELRVDSANMAQIREH